MIGMTKEQYADFMARLWAEAHRAGFRGWDADQEVCYWEEDERRYREEKEDMYGDQAFA